MCASSRRPPVIGVTAGRDGPTADVGAHYIVRRNYCDCIESAGAIPVILPYTRGSIAAVVAMLDGLLITGGDFDIPPSYYKGCESKDGVYNCDRTKFEYSLVKHTLSFDMPVLGVCGGMQLMAVAMGGSLISDIAACVPGSIEHHQTTPRTMPAHSTVVHTSSLLYEALGRERIETNSYHHQAVDRVPSNVCVSARATDGVVEAIEAFVPRFWVGVQWHPEYCIGGEEALFEMFVERACRYREGKGRAGFVS